MISSATSSPPSPRCSNPRSVTSPTWSNCCFPGAGECCDWRNNPPGARWVTTERKRFCREGPGIVLEIKPPRKAPRSMSLLSGGEKALAALSFLFALFLARPCPFYVLDEVEAALDDVNLGRFLSLVKRYQDQTQFIIITHQRRTMEIADTLYGVAMDADGTSRVLSRRLSATGTGQS